MTQPLNNFLRGLSLAAVLMASSCAGPNGDSANQTFEDGTRNHPIAVEPSYQSLKLSYAPAEEGLSPAEAGRLDAFVADYRLHGTGSIAVSAPAGLNATAAITFFADRINRLGVGRDHILVSSHDAPNGDLRVELNFVSYVAHADDCGDWSEDLAFTLANNTPKNFGCSVQHNIAAMVADPRDLVSPRPMDDGGDANRRATVIGHYEKGEVTQATKRTSDATTEQSAPGSTGLQ